MCDMLFILDKYDIPSYADDNTIYSRGETTENVILNLEKLSENLFQWFYLNQMKGNPCKCHLFLSTGDKITLIVQDLNITIAKKNNSNLIFSLTLRIFAKKAGLRYLH